MNSHNVVFISLGLVLAANSSLAATSTRLFEIFSERFVKDTSGQPLLELGRLTAQGEYKHYIYVQLPVDTVIPAEALNQNLLPFSVFPAYDVLGGDVLANFQLGKSVKVTGGDYFVVAVAPNPKLDIGVVSNLSTRGAILPAGDPLIGGFFVEDHPRRVLVRAIGPTLSSFGTTGPLANPVLTLMRQGERTSVATNDDWAQQSNANEIESAAVAVGAFPLDRASKDSVLLLELAPGGYTAQVTSANASGGTALLEIYLLP